MKRKRARKGQVPPQLRRYLFRKGRRQVNPRTSRTAKCGRTRLRRRSVKLIRKKTVHRHARRRNPLQAPAVRHYIFARRGGGQRLHFNGTKFTNNGTPAYFNYAAQAKSIALELIRKFPMLRTYDVYVTDTAKKH